MNQLHSFSFFATGTECRNRPLYSAGPIPVCLGPGHVESVCTGEQISNHNNANPRVTPEERFHHYGVEVFLIIELVGAGSESGKKRDLRECCARLLSRIAIRMLQRVLP